MKKRGIKTLSFPFFPCLLSASPVPGIKAELFPYFYVYVAMWVCSQPALITLEMLQVTNLNVEHAMYSSYFSSALSLLSHNRPLWYVMF